MKIACQAVVLVLVAYGALFAPMPGASANTPAFNGSDAANANAAQIAALLKLRQSIVDNYNLLELKEGILVDGYLDQEAKLHNIIDNQQGGKATPVQQAQLNALD